MRPIKLKLQAFGPYDQEVIVDFSQFNTNEIFLISGNTGSGKTVIFDAISYALYGKASGSMRDVSMLRNRSSDSRTKTYVELSFEYNNQEYTISRNPSYRRAKLSGEGETDELASANLILPTKEEISGINEVNNKILEILKINQNQFSQIVMIAQNDFQKFLSANTSDRKEILRTIFKTDFYLDFENELKSNLSIKKLEYQRIITEYNSHLHSVKDLDEDFYLLDNYHNEEVSKKLSKSIILNDKKIADFKNLEADLNSKISDLNKDLTLAKNNNQIIETYNKHDKKYQELIAKKTSVELIEEKLLKLNIIKSQLIHLYNKVAGDSKNLKIEKDINEKLVSTLNDLSKQFEVVSKEYSEIEKYQTLVDKLNKDINTYNNLKKDYILAYEIKDSIGVSESNLLKIKSSIANIVYSNYLKYNKLKKEYESDLLTYQSKKAESLELSKKYDELEALFLDSQVGILASKLKADEACPVCGSLNHPKKALLKVSDIDSEYLNIKELNLAKISELNELLNKLESKKSELDKLSIVYNESLLLSKLDLDSVNKLRNDNETDFDLNYLIKKNQEELDLLIENKAKYKTLIENKEFSSLELLNKQIEILLKEKDDNTTLISSINDKYKLISDKLVEFKTRYSESSNNLIKLEAEYVLSNSKYQEELLKNFESEEVFLQFKEDLLKIDDLTKTVSDYNEEVLKVSALYSEYKELSKDLEFSNVDELNEKITKLNNELLLSSDERHKLLAINEHNSDLKLKLEKLSEEIILVEKEYQDYQILADTASGSLSGKSRIQFETYAQMAYFDKVIHYANKRLKIMSNNQYELVRRVDQKDLRSQGGLDLDIIDHHYGNQRDVKSLSGGESFNTALSLALGLSDAIVYASGGIFMDALFIDEGFGTLSDDYLDNAINTLNDVANSDRMIGVISHVKELKDLISQQIIVTKDDEGSSVQVIID